MRGLALTFAFALGSGIAIGCATTEDELGENQDSGAGGGIGLGGFTGSGGTVGSGGVTSSGGSGGGSGTGGTPSDASVDASTDASSDGAAEAGDAGDPSGFGPCVTEADIAGQSGPFMIGFCPNPFACFLCTNDAVKPGDIVCSPKCLCVPLPPICTDGGVDGGDAGDASSDGSVPDASSDAPSDAPAG